MGVEIKMSSVEPVRQTYSRTARRFGGDKPATRYQEASFDLQPRENFHYRPVWDPQHDLYDAGRTVLRMCDWDGIGDPRQYYYATYVLNRARMQESAEKNFEIVEKHGLMRAMPAAERAWIESLLLPLRHAEWAANLNNCYITAYCFGSSMAQAAMYNTADRLGMAQYLSRMGLMLDGNSGGSLEQAKQSWLQAAQWQPMRRYVEDAMAIRDWFETFVAQNLILDGLLHPAIYGHRTLEEGDPADGTVVKMLTEFMEAWFPDCTKWVDACVRAVAAESEFNRGRVSAWCQNWMVRALQALEALGGLEASGPSWSVKIESARIQLEARLQKLGLVIG
jgi:phenol hydroxylase P1 protein